MSIGFSDEARCRGFADAPTPWRLIRAAALIAWIGSGCLVSFDGYEPLESSGSSGGGGFSGSSGSATVGGASTSSQASASGATGGGGAGAEGGSGASGNGGGGGSGGMAARCPTAGGSMVALQAPGGDYCVDSTEVTQGRYQAFLAAGPDIADQIPACAGNASFDPTCNFTPVPTPNQPVVCVDWCDAHAFCAFVGKRLCGKIGGGATSSAGADDPSASQWYRACSTAGASIYPYGDLYEPDRCNGVDSPIFGTADVALLAQCVGGYPGIWDMSGNTREWEDGCEGSNCLQRGGSWLNSDTSSPHSLRCDSAGMGPRTQANNEVGFRCCAEL